MLDAAGEHVVSSKIREKDTREEVGDKLQQIMLWSSKTLSPSSEVLADPPFSKEEAPEIVGTVIFYHYINRMAHVFLSESPLPSTSSWLRSIIRPIAVYRFARVIQSRLPPGEALKLLPPAALPEDLRWTRPNIAVEGAYARLSAIISDIEKEILPEEVKEVMQAQILEWEGEVPRTSHSWIQRIIKDSKISQPRTRIATGSSGCVGQQSCGIRLGGEDSGAACSERTSRRRGSAYAR